MSQEACVSDSNRGFELDGGGGGLAGECWSTGTWFSHGHSPFGFAAQPSGRVEGREPDAGGGVRAGLSFVHCISLGGPRVRSALK